MPLDGFSDDGRKKVFIPALFNDIVIDPLLHRLDGDSFTSPSRDNDDRHVILHSLDLFEYLKTVHRRQTIIEENDGETGMRELLKASPAIFRNGNFGAGTLLREEMLN